jgi:y4mF family transcriptional regulator
MQDIGRIVRLHRKSSGLTQIELARMAGIGKSAVFNIEKGKSTVRLDTLLKVLSVLNITLQVKSPLIERWEDDSRRRRQDETR